MSEINSFFQAKNVAVVGVSKDKQKIGSIVFNNFLNKKFKGKVFPVNPKYEKVFNKKCFSSVKEIPEKIDLVIVAVKNVIVPAIVKDCVEKKVKAIIVLSAGFSETGKKELEQKILTELKKSNGKTRLIGPNCLGVYSSESFIDSLFLPKNRLQRPSKGNIAFISQSGALGSAVLDWTALKNYGLSSFVSYGNALDVDESDLLEYFYHDKETKVITMYIEGVKKGRKFFQTLKKVNKKKPVIILKGGASNAGNQATLSHTGSLAGSSQVFDAVIKQCNAVKAETLQELFDFARTLSINPKPKGRKTQIITNGGGYGVLTTDCVENSGLKFAKLSRQTLKKIRSFSRDHAVLKNPIDLTGDADNEMFEKTLTYCLEDKNVDLIVLILLFQVPTINEQLIPRIAGIIKHYNKPVVSVSVGGAFSEKQRKKLEEKGILTFDNSPEAVKSLKALVEYYKK
ncbi:MAG: CoA-binding protein [archaeon]